MAEKTLQKVEDELTTCSICLDIYTNPKLLQCFHVYCQGCLARLVFRDQQGQLVLTCPDCRQVTPVPAGEVAGLQSAFHINHLLGIMEEHKKGKDGSAQTENSSSSKYATHDKDDLFCPKHTDEELKLYCETCGKLICLKCVIKGGEHHDHQYELMDTAFEKYKDAIKVSLEPVETQMANVKKALDQLDACHEKITDQIAGIEANIHSSIGHLQEILEVRKAHLIDQLHKIIQGKLKCLAAQKDQLETIQAQLGSCHDFMKKSVESDSHRDVLKMKTRVVNQVTELTAPIQPDLLEPCTEADILFSGSADAIKHCLNYGQLAELSLLDPSQCYATGEGLTAATAENKAETILHASNKRGEPFVKPIESVECELVSALTGTTVISKVETIKQNKYKIVYQPTIKGRHWLHIKVEGKHIKGSPFSVAVKSSGWQLGDPVGSFHGVHRPLGVALTHKQNLIISGHLDDCIHVFRPDGKKLRLIGSRGTGQGQFKNPTGVAVDRHGNILAVDCCNDRVQKFTADGKFLVGVGSKGKKKLQFDNPYGIAVHPSNNRVYVVDTYNHRVQVLTSALNYTSSFGSKGRGNGQLLCPKDIACDCARKVLYVADQVNNRIQVFTEEGKFVRVFGSHGKDEREVSRPSGVAVDSNGIVYVSEDGSHCISMFTPDGEFVKSFGGSETLKSPCGLVVDCNGVVYVCDIDTNCTLMF